MLNDLWQLIKDLCCEALRLLWVTILVILIVAAIIAAWIGLGMLIQWYFGLSNAFYIIWGAIPFMGMKPAAETIIIIIKG